MNGRSWPLLRLQLSVGTGAWRAASSTKICSGRPKWFPAFIARWAIKAQAMVVEREGIVFLESSDALVDCKRSRSNCGLRLAQSRSCLFAVCPNLLHETHRKDLVVVLFGEQRPIGIASPAKHRDRHRFPLKSLSCEGGSKDRFWPDSSQAIRCHEVLSLGYRLPGMGPPLPASPKGWPLTSATNASPTSISRFVGIPAVQRPLAIPMRFSAFLSIKPVFSRSASSNDAIALRTTCRPSSVAVSTSRESIDEPEMKPRDARSQSSRIR